MGCGDRQIPAYRGLQHLQRAASGRWQLRGHQQRRLCRQSKSLEALERLYGLSKPQLEFLRNASEGHGIIKMGNSMIPFSNLEPKDTAVYKLITTKPGEATAEK